MQAQPELAPQAWSGLSGMPGMYGRQEGSQEPQGPSEVPQPQDPTTSNPARPSLGVRSLFCTCCHSEVIASTWPCLPRLSHALLVLGPAP